MPIDIYSEPGKKIKFANPDAGYEPDRECAKKNLVLDREYTVDFVEISSFHSRVTLREIRGIRFNTVMFDELSI